jgi:hypothetical protein
MTRGSTILCLLLALVAGSGSTARADRMKLARELAEAALGRLGRGAAREGGEALAKRLASAAARHGDNLVMGAFRKVGPRALALADDAGKHAPAAMRLLVRHGDEAAGVLTKRSIRLLSLGDDAAEMLVKHKGISTPLLETFGNSATRALVKINPRNGRRLAMLKDNLLRLKKAKQLMEVIEKYGDPAMDWIWKNKGALAASTAMAAFLANPQPFLDGTKQLAETVAEKAVAPVANSLITGGVKIVDTVARSAVEPVAREAARALPWAELSLLGVGMLGVLAALGLSRWEHRRRVTAELS